MKKGALFCIILLGIIFYSSLINAAPPFISTSNFGEGYFIKVPPINPLKQNQDFNLNFHVFNISNGFPIDNSSTACILHLYLPNGTQVIQQEIKHDIDSTVNNEWEILIDGNNFSSVGNYAYLIQCNDSSIGGLESVGFEVTKLGVENTTSESLIYILLTFAVLFFFLFSLYFTIITPYSNKVNDKGAIIKIVKLKYVKLALVMLDYVLLVWFLNVLIGVSDNFVSLTLYYGFVSFLFITLNALALPFGIFIFVLFMFELIKDTNIQKAISKFGSAK